MRLVITWAAPPRDGSRCRPTDTPLRSLMIAGTLLALVGCGGATEPAATRPARGAVDDGVEVRLGCTIVSRAQVDDALARLRVLEPGATRAHAGELAVRRAVLARYARRHHIEVTDDHIDRAVSRLAAENGRSIDEVYAAVAEEGLDRDAYRAELAAQLLEERVLQLLARPPAEAEVTAEIERLRGEAPALSEDELRDDAQQAILRRGAESALSELIRRMREARPRATPDGCVDDA